MREDVKYYLFLTIMILFFGSVFLLMILLTIDAPTTKVSGTEYGPCVDDNGDDFVDEVCLKKKYCSWLGVAQETRCKDVLGGKDE